jgi:hypothetical protein
MNGLATDVDSDLLRTGNRQVSDALELLREARRNFARAGCGEFEGWVKGFVLGLAPLLSQVEREAVRRDPARRSPAAPPAEEEEGADSPAVLRAVGDDSPVSLFRGGLVVDMSAPAVIPSEPDRPITTAERH